LLKIIISLSGVHIINSLTRKALAVGAITAALTGCNLGKINLTIEIHGNGSVISDDEHINCPIDACTFDYQYMVNSGVYTEVTLSATPEDGYAFTGFGEDSACINSDSFETATCVIIADASKTVVAMFTDPNTVENWSDHFHQRQFQTQEYLLAKQEQSLEAQMLRFKYNTGPLHTPAFDAAEAKLTAREDTADFRTPALIRMLYQYADSPLMTESLYQRIENLLLNFKYWPDEPGNDPMIMWSENHQVLFLSAGFLMGQQYPDDIFTNSGMTGTQLMDKSRRLLMRWFRLRAKTGFSEWHSNTYYEEDLGPLITLIDFSEDAVIAKNAEAAANIIFLDMALYSHDGVFGGSHGRTYPSEMTSPLTEGTSGTSYIAFNQGPFRTRYGLSAYQLALTEKFVPAAAIMKLGRKQELTQNENIPKITAVPQFDIKKA